MTKPSDFHGPHSTPGPDAEFVDWCKPTLRFARVRVLWHTCECKPHLYGFCVAGGLAWVRWTARAEAVKTVRESRPTAFGQAEQLWEKILNGCAR